MARFGRVYLTLIVERRVEYSTVDYSAGGGGAAVMDTVRSGHWVGTPATSHFDKHCGPGTDQRDIPRLGHCTLHGLRELGLTEGSCTHSKSPKTSANGLFWE